MAKYQPSDTVLVAIGAAHPGPPMCSVAERLLQWSRGAEKVLDGAGVDSERRLWFEEEIEGLLRMMKSSRAQKHDVALQMRDLVALISEARGWLKTLRMAAAINLASDTPALLRVASPDPELCFLYPRDFAKELQSRLTAARDLAPRLADSGLTARFLQRGFRLFQQIHTAIGPRDLAPDDLELELRRLYLRKGAMMLELTRWARIGALFMPDEHEQWHLGPLVPTVEVPLSG